MSLALILAIVALVLSFLDVVLWHAVSTYRNRFLIGIAVMVLSIAVILMTMH